jgi:hypothetical protein
MNKTVLRYKSSREIFGRYARRNSGINEKMKKRMKNYSR